MTNKWKCTTFVVEGHLKPLRWFDRWNPWALRRKIQVLKSTLDFEDKMKEELKARLQMCCKENVERRKHIESQAKRIKELESELSVKYAECDLHMATVVSVATG